MGKEGADKGKATNGHNTNTGNPGGNDPLTGNESGGALDQNVNTKVEKGGHGHSTGRDVSKKAGGK